MTATTAKISAAQRRHQAAGKIFSDLLGDDGRRELTETAAEIIARIEALRPLGRTDRWGAALDRWIAMVTDHGRRTVTDPTEADLPWAITQGSIYAQIAA